MPSVITFSHYLRGQITMDAKTELALMTKVGEVYRAEDTFLSFPIVPRAFTKEDLNSVANPFKALQALPDSLGAAVKDPESLPDSLEAAVDFSHLVNLIPRGLLWMPDPDRFLWDIYHNVLESSGEPVELAKMSWSPEEEQEFQSASKVLHDMQDDGTWADTPQVQRYNQYRDQWFALQQEYNYHKSNTLLAGDAKIRKRWQSDDEPAMRTQMDALYTDWVVNGSKREVEAAQSAYVRLSAKSPEVIWDQWHAQINPFIDTVTSPITGQSVYLTSFAPSDAIDDSSWLRVTLRGADVDALMKQAPEELKKRLAPESVPQDIETLSFECSSVSVTRPWLMTGLFEARFWRFHGDVEPLSDGQIPPQGRCPAYVVAVVFARNVDARMKQGGRPPRGWWPPSHWRFFSVSASPAPAEIPAAASYHMDRLRTMKAAALLQRQDFSRLSNPAKGIATTSVAPGDRFRLASVDAGLSRRTLEGAPSGQQDEPIYVLAFICKRLPRCPNPDPSLQW